MSITIYHNPKCGTSRNTLALIRNTGAEPEVIEYLKTPPDRVSLENLIAAMGQPVRDIMRQKEAIYSELKLDESHWTDADLISKILEHPILLNRPIV